MGSTSSFNANLWTVLWAICSLIAWGIRYLSAKSVLREYDVKIPEWIEWFAPMMLVFVVKDSHLGNARSLFLWGCVAAVNLMVSIAAVWASVPQV